MVRPFTSSLRAPRRLGQVAMTALLIGLGATALTTAPLGNLALAGNGNGNGGGHGHGDHGGGNGNGGGQGHGGGPSGGHGGGGNSGKSGNSGTDDATGEADDLSSTSADVDDESMSPHGLGKLNGFFHASPNGLANASPNSSIGRISHAFKEALEDFADANTPTDPNDPNATPPTGPTTEDLGAILGGAVNKPVTATQVNAIIDKLAGLNPEDPALGGLADSIDDATAQDIADAANATRTGAVLDDGTDGDGSIAN